MALPNKIAAKILVSLGLKQKKIARKFKPESKKKKLDIYPPVKVKGLEKHKFYEGKYTCALTHNDVRYDFLISHKRENKALVIMMDSAVSRHKFALPYFPRHSWTEDFNATVIVTSDPTLRISKKLNGAWWQGEKDKFYLDELATIISKFAEGFDELYLFGSSICGFAALHLAQHLNPKLTIVINPQTYLPIYFPTHLGNMCQIVYKSTPEKVAKKYPDRMGATKGYKGLDGKILYIQNKFDKHHYKKHLPHFLSQHGEYAHIKPGDKLANKINVITYSDAVLKHSPPQKKETYDLIAPYMKGILKNGGKA